MKRTIHFLPPIVIELETKSDYSFESDCIKIELDLYLKEEDELNEKSKMRKSDNIVKKIHTIGKNIWDEMKIQII